MTLALSVLAGAISFALFRPNLAASLLATALVPVLVKTILLLRRHLTLTNKLNESCSRRIDFTGEEVRSRLESGLRLIDTVVAPQEAVVFAVDENRNLRPAARHRRSQSGRLDSKPNSAWRDGISLCESAIKAGDLITQKRDPGESSTNIALPLRYGQRVVGALLLRIAGEFDPRDRELLLAVGEQLARTLLRGIARKTSQFDSIDALDGVITEQPFVANSLEEVSDGLAIAYLDGTLGCVNSHLLQLANLSTEDVGRLSLFDLLDALRAGVFDEPEIAVRRVLQTGMAYERELQFEDRNGTFGLRMTLVRDRQSSNPLCLAITVRDLTPIKEFEQLKSDMISLMSHELRTPLTSINGFSELLVADQNLPEPAKEFVSIIATESQRLSRMINTFLAVAQLERKDKQEVLKIPLRMDQVVRDTLASLQPVARKKRIRLVEQPSQRIPPVAADKGLISKALTNLITNAIKYSPERTTVTVSTALEAEAVRVCVEDRGFGIPPEAVDRVWEKFYRVVREGQEKDEESTGLGLAFVREVVEQHGGSVDLQTEEGRGSKFSFTLPRL